VSESTNRLTHTEIARLKHLTSSSSPDNPLQQAYALGLKRCLQLAADIVKERDLLAADCDRLRRELDDALGVIR